MSWITYLLDSLGALAGGSVYYMHAVCLTYDPWIIWPLSAAHAVIWASYLLISQQFRLPAIRDRFPMPRLFQWFICLCGWGHVAAVLTIWTPFYRFVLAIDVVTMAVSVPAAYAFMRLRQRWEAQDRQGAKIEAKEPDLGAPTLGEKADQPA